MSETTSVESLGKEGLVNLTKQIAKGGGIGFTGQLLGKGLIFLLHILLTRVLGTSAYGLYALGYNVFFITQRFSMLGFQSGVVRYGSTYRGEGDIKRLKGTLITSLGITFLSALVISFLLFRFSGIISNHLFNEPALTNVIRIFSFALPFYSLMFIASFSARAFRRMKYAIGIEFVLHPLIYLISVGLIFLLGYRLIGVIYAFLISAVSSAILGTFLLWKIFPDLISNLKPKFEFKTILTYSLTVLLIGFSQILLLAKADRVMLGIFGLAQDVGIYNAAVVMASQTSLFLYSFNAIFSPIIADLFNKGRMDQLSRLFKIITKWIFTLTFPVFLVFLLFPRQIMGLFGPEFKTGWSSLVTLGVANLINASVGSVGFMLTMTGRQKLELTNSIFLGGLNIFLNVLLIQRYGILGAAIATGTSIGLINIARLLEVFYLYRIHPYNLSYWKPVIAGVVAALSLILLNRFIPNKGWFWLGGVVLLGLIYLLSFILFGLEEEDRIVIQAIKKIGGFSR